MSEAFCSEKLSMILKKSSSLLDPEEATMVGLANHAFKIKVVFSEKLVIFQKFQSSNCLITAQTLRGQQSNGSEHLFGREPMHPITETL
jgi:hypothetical protein